MPAGYSKRTLCDKLGIKPGNKLLLIDVPENYFELLEYLPEDVEAAELEELAPNAQDRDFVHWFTQSTNGIPAQLKRLKGLIKPSGMIWVSWPKQSSPMAGPLKEGMIRKPALALDLVDVKVCAVDQDWCGLKLMIRKEKRK